MEILYYHKLQLQYVLQYGLFFGASSLVSENLTIKNCRSQNIENDIILVKIVLKGRYTKKFSTSRLLDNDRKFIFYMNVTKTVWFSDKFNVLIIVRKSQTIVLSYMW